MYVREAIHEYAAENQGIEPIVEQVQENLRGTECLDRDGRIGTILPIPIGAKETPETIEAGIRALDSSRMPQTTLAFSINHVGEQLNSGWLQEVSEVVQASTKDASFASTFFTENYSTQDGTMGNIRARLLGATAVAMLRSGYPLSRVTTVISGDIDLLKAGVGLLPRLSAAARTKQFAQAAVMQGYSRHLHAAGLLDPSVSFPNMDKVLYFYNRAINECEFAAHGVWNAMLLGDYFDAGGYDLTKKNGEDFDLQDRLYQLTGRTLTHKIPLQTNAFAVVQQRRFYARMQSGPSILDSHNTETDFSTVDDICRGKSYEDFHDITLEEADVAINTFFGLTRELGPLRSLGDSIVWWKFQKRFDTRVGRYPQEGWEKSLRPEDLDAYDEAQYQTRGLFKIIQGDYARIRQTGFDRHTP